MADSLAGYGKSASRRTDGTCGIGVRMASPVRRATTSKAAGGVNAAGPRLSHPGECLGLSAPRRKGRIEDLASDANRRRFKTGTKIIREWKGQLHEVAVTAEGYVYKGDVYKSLSPIAFRITGPNGRAQPSSAPRLKEGTR